LGFALSEEAQRKHEILNASAMVQYTAPEDSAWAAARRLGEAVQGRRVSRSAFADIMSIVANAGSIISGAFKKYVSAFEIILPNPRIEVIVNLEQEPNRESRIRLGDDVDALGVRRIEVDWHLSEIERKTARFFAEALAKVFENLELSNCELASWLFAEGSVRDTAVAGNYHFIGATRMASAPSNGVVDENCRAFGISNLFFAGTSVFPTGGHANPTLTIVALAIRLSDHLRSELASTTWQKRSDVTKET
jgi:choline dehydrogenase-like flavoprotein